MSNAPLGMIESTEASARAGAGVRGRLASLDAYRGFVMFLMMAEALHLAAVSASLPGNTFWALLAQNQTHEEWVGCSLHDLIQPSFSFIVGVALPFSIAARRARGHSTWLMSRHAFWRAAVLVFLGIFLRSIGKAQTNYTFEDTLTQIGLGYGFLFLLGFRPVREQWAAFLLLLGGYWLAFAAYPAPGADFPYKDVGVSADWLSQHGLSGFLEHWNKNSNVAWAFDTWFLNLFPRERPFAFNGGGYATLSFIPTLATMILGLIAGETLHGDRSRRGKILWLASAGVLCVLAGRLLGQFGVCPVVKRIWTPSWVLFSGGWSLLLMAVFYLILDVWRWRWWAFPLVVIGMNSIGAYCMDHLFGGFVRSSLMTHFGSSTFRVLGEAYEPLLLGGGTLLVLWLILLWMYRRKLFLRI